MAERTKSARQTEASSGVSTRKQDSAGKIAYLKMVNDRIMAAKYATVGLKLVLFLFVAFLLTRLNLYTTIVAICMTFLFCAADATLKRHELIYRKLYNDIRNDDHKIDFNLYPKYGQDQVVTWWYAFRRSSVWIYYTVIMVLFIVCIILMLTMQ